MRETYTAKQYGYEQPILLVVAPLTVISLIVIYVVASQTGGALWLLVLGVAVILGLLIAPLTIQVTDSRIRVRLAWVWRREIDLKDVKAAESRQYRALKQFGGWGWRFGRDGSRAYTMKGNVAAVVSLHDGRDIYLGARDTQALADAIRVRMPV